MKTINTFVSVIKVIHGIMENVLKNAKKEKFSTMENVFVKKIMFIGIENVLLVQKIHGRKMENNVIARRIIIGTLIQILVITLFVVTILMWHLSIINSNVSVMMGILTIMENVKNLFHAHLVQSGIKKNLNVNVPLMMST